MKECKHDFSLDDSLRIVWKTCSTDSQMRNSRYQLKNWVIITTNWLLILSQSVSEELYRVLSSMVRSEDLLISEQPTCDPITRPLPQPSLWLISSLMHSYFGQTSGIYGHGRARTEEYVSLESTIAFIVKYPKNYLLITVNYNYFYFIYF